uniref:Uncharacterized protein n=1 Tax=Cyanothece sp. (strain PCC 7425 / ATCC 29141) TaxID=395961 RepID=B8HXY4_CYAP4
MKRFPCAVNFVRARLQAGILSMATLNGLRKKGGGVPPQKGSTPLPRFNLKEDCYINIKSNYATAVSIADAD